MPKKKAQISVQGLRPKEAKPSVAGDHHRHDPEDQVVEVDAAVADHAARPPGDPRAAHQPRAHADEGEGEDEADEDQEEALLFVFDEAGRPEVGDEARRR